MSYALEDIEHNLSPTAVKTVIYLLVGIVIVYTLVF